MQVTWMGFLAVGLGGMLGCWARWLAAVGLNTLGARVPLGTLLVNLAGGFIIGGALGYLSQHPEWRVEWRLFVMTGFLGGLTTFSTFSAEALNLILRGEYAWGVWHVLVHLVGSIACCAVGYVLARQLAGA